MIAAIKVKATNEFLALREDGFNYLMTVGFFDMGDLGRSRSYPFTFPANLHNQAQLGAFNLLEISSNAQYIEVELWLMDNFYADAKLKVSYSNGEFEGTVFLDLLGQVDIFKNTKIASSAFPDLRLDVARFTVAQLTTSALQALPFEYNYTELVTVKIRFTDDTATLHEFEYTSVVGQVEFAHLKVAELFNDANLNATMSVVVNSGIVEITVGYVPGDIFIDYIFPNVPNTETFQFAEDVGYPGGIAATINHTRENLFVFPVIFAPDFFENAPPGYSGFLNEYDRGIQAYSGNFLVPSFFVKGLLEQICNNVGMKITGDWWTDEGFENLITLSNRQMPGVTVLNIGDYLPDMSLGEMIKQLGIFCIYYTYDPVRNILSINKKKERLKTIPADYSHQIPVQNGQYSKEQQPIRGLQLEYKDKILEPFVLGEPEQVLAFEASAIRNTFQDGIKCPWWSGKGVDESDSENQKRLENLNLTFWNGMQAGAGGTDYPCATNDNVDYANQEIGTDSYSLAWTGPRGLYEQLWKEWVDVVVNAVKIGLNFNMSAYDLYSFRVDAPFKVWHMVFMPDSIDIELSETGNQAEIDCYKIRQFRLNEVEDATLGDPVLLDETNFTQVFTYPSGGFRARWQAADNALEYEWQLSDTEDFSNIIDTGTTSALDVLFSGMVCKNYWYRVRSKRNDQLGNWVVNPANAHEKSFHFRGNLQSRAVEFSRKITDLAIINCFDWAADVKLKYADGHEIADWSVYSYDTLANIQTAIANGNATYSLLVEVDGYAAGYSDAVVVMQYTDTPIRSFGCLSTVINHVTQDIMIGFGVKVQFGVNETISVYPNGRLRLKYFDAANDDPFVYPETIATLNQKLQVTKPFHVVSIAPDFVAPLSGNLINYTIYSE